MALNKPQYEVFNEIVDFFWRNLDLRVPAERQAIIARKLLNEIKKIARS